MTEDRLREIVAAAISNAKVQFSAADITDETSTDTVATFDSHAVMSMALEWENEVDYQLSDDEISTLTSWPNILSVLLSHETGNTVAFYKALVLDADGTLWGGIAAEGGAQVTATFCEVQAIYRGMGGRGVILAIATKNEPGEVEAVLNAPEGFLEVDDFTLIHSGWGNKVLSLRDIAKTLNIGLDAIVFVDDSSFECEYVRSHLPEVKVVQVPKNIADYPRVAREVADLFPTLVDVAKTDEYRALAAAERTRPQFTSEAEYLSSLGMVVTLHCNIRDEIPRIAELTQKANQFNLTTRRYTEADIASWMDRGYVYSVHVKDKFADQGLTGVVIIEQGKVDTFLLSCRILGRGIEKALWGPILETMRDIGWKWIMAAYVPSGKNEQVRSFWSDLGFEPRIGGEWIHALDTLDVKCPAWVKVTK